MARCFLGLDSSTQGLTAVLIDLDSRRVVGEAALSFDAALPAYGTRNGVLRSDDPRVVHAPPLMWAEALDLVFASLARQAAPLGELLAISGSGQQHGSVYLNAGAERVIEALDPSRPLAAQLAGVFARSTAPTWMDSSTSEECREIEAALGGPRATAEATGSAAFERFTGPQIRRFFKTSPEDYARTVRISLVSSFLASLVAGRLAPIDHGDGAGMNLMDIRRRCWHPQALAATAPDLERRLLPPVPPWQVVSPVARYWAERHAVNPAALACVWSGDNPCSVVGTGLVRPGQVAISLGTSDTYFGTMAECRIDPAGEGHAFAAPTGAYMSLICFKNGSLARERVRDLYGLDWGGFSRAIASTPPGNHGKLMLPYFEPEIVPRVPAPGVRRFDLREDDVAGNCRAVVEAQMLSMRRHSAWMGVRPERIYATGGASRNPEILQVMADVHECPVSRFEVTNSAALGAALRAAHAWHARGERPLAWPDVVEGFCDPVPGSEIRPRPEAAAAYRPLLARLAELSA
ncbi:MAG: xylulokinase [Vicinamibacteria bacterium]